jgi:hypothetical protein
MKATRIKAPSSKAAKSKAKIWDADSEQQWFIDKAAGGAAWAQRFIELARAKPEKYALEVWIDDGERLFEGNRKQLDAFYDALQEAIVGVKAEPDTPRAALDFVDDIERKTSQASAIFALMGLAGTTNEAIPDVTLANAGWAGRDLLEQADELANDMRELMLRAQPGEVANV